jgi:hypothetical protein
MALIALLAGLTATMGLETALGATTERVVVNRYSGVAIEGFDPVAYFRRRPAGPRHAGSRGGLSRRGVALPQ